MCLYSGFGFKKGLLVTLFSILSFILSIYLTYLLLPHFTNFLVNVFNVDKYVGNIVKDNNFLNSFLTNNDNVLFDLIKMVLHIDENMINSTITTFIINIVAFISLTIILKLLLKFVFKLVAISLKNFFIIGSLDRMCGLCFGFVKGVLIISLLCLVVLSLNQLDGINNIIGEQVATSNLIYVFNDGANFIAQTFKNIIH